MEVFIYDKYNSLILESVQKFSADDVPLFEALIKDLFPDLVEQRESDSKF